MVRHITDLSLQSYNGPNLEDESPPVDIFIQYGYNFTVYSLLVYSTTLDFKQVNILTVRFDREEAKLFFYNREQIRLNKVEQMAVTASTRYKLWQPINTLIVYH